MLPHSGQTHAAFWSLFIFPSTVFRIYCGRTVELFALVSSCTVGIVLCGKSMRRIIVVLPVLPVNSRYRRNCIRILRSMTPCPYPCRCHLHRSRRILWYLRFVHLQAGVGIPMPQLGWTTRHACTVVQHCSLSELARDRLGFPIVLVFHPPVVP